MHNKYQHGQHEILHQRFHNVHFKSDQKIRSQPKQYKADCAEWSLNISSEIGIVQLASFDSNMSSFFCKMPGNVKSQMIGKLLKDILNQFQENSGRNL